jgi:hypothetical protein
MMPGGGERVMTLDLRADQSLPAFTRSSLDGDLGNGDANSGDPEGQLNGGLIWEPRSIVDEAGVWEITLRVTDGARADRATADVTPRRRQQFKTRPGDVVSWTTQASGRVIQSGEATADQWGLVTVPQVEIRRSGSRLSIRLENRSR